jgi:hypothetical protein
MTLTSLMRGAGIPRVAHPTCACARSVRIDGAVRPTIPAPASDFNSWRRLMDKSKPPSGSCKSYLKRDFRWAKTPRSRRVEKQNDTTARTTPMLRKDGGPGRSARHPGGFSRSRSLFLPFFLSFPKGICFQHLRCRSELTQHGRTCSQRSRNQVCRRDKKQLPYGNDRSEKQRPVRNAG